MVVRGLVPVALAVIYQDDANMRAILENCGWPDYGINHLTDLRAKNQRMSLEETPEHNRLMFYRALAESGRIGRMDRHPSMEGIKDLRWVDFAPARSRHQHPYSG